MQQRSLLLASLSVSLIATAFAACTSLDSRKVLRGSEDGSAGDFNGNDNGSGGEDHGAGGELNTGNTPGVAGDASGGEGPLVNPFGGESFGGAPPVVDGPPEVLKVDPVDLAVDAEPTGDVSLLFSEAIEPKTVTAANIKLMDGTTEIAGTLTPDGEITTLHPTKRLSLLAGYDVSVSQNVTDSANQKLKAAFASKFTVRDGVWSKPTAAFDDPMGTRWARTQEIGTDADGNSMFVYPLRDAVDTTKVQCYARRFRLTGGLGEAFPLGAAGEGCTNAQLAVAPNGDAIVAWYTGAYPAYELRAQRFVNGSWEASAQSLTPAMEPGDGYTLSVAIGGGQVLVGYMRSYYGDVNNTYYYSNVNLAVTTLTGTWPASPYSAASAFTDYTPMGTTSESLYGMDTALDGAGNALVTWWKSSTDANTSSVYYARKTPAQAWQLAVPIPMATMSPNTAPLLVSDGDGAMLTWSVYDPMTTKYQLLASRYTKAKQFVAPVAINDPDVTEYILVNPRHSMAANSKSIVATWTQVIGASRNAYANVYDVATSKWGTALPLSDGATSVGSYSTTGLDAHGNALVAFEQTGTMSSFVLGSRYVAATGKWSTAEPLTPNTADSWHREPQLTTAANGVSMLLYRAGHSPGPKQPEVGVQGGLFRVFK